MSREEIDRLGKEYLAELCEKYKSSRARSFRCIGYHLATNSLLAAIFDKKEQVKFLCETLEEEWPYPNNRCPLGYEKPSECDDSQALDEYATRIVELFKVMVDEDEG